MMMQLSRGNIALTISSAFRRTARYPPAKPQSGTSRAGKWPVSRTDLADSSTYYLFRTLGTARHRLSLNNIARTRSARL